MENINHFLLAAGQYGVPQYDLFQTVDLYEDKNMVQVINAIHALGGRAQKNRFDGPVIGVKHADTNMYVTLYQCPLLSLPPSPPPPREIALAAFFLCMLLFFLLIYFMSFGTLPRTCRFLVFT